MSGRRVPRPAWTRGVGLRIALAAILTTALAVGIVALGVLVVGGDTFARLMMQHGASAEDAHAMFNESVTLVLIAAVVGASIAAATLAAVMGRRLGRPLREIAAAARRVAAGDYAARVPRSGPEEIASLADSFNQMAASLDEQERLRRELIANAAHELKTPLTNLIGYLEALRDGVMPADDAAFASLQEEAERIGRLAASLDALADGDAGSAPPPLVELDLSATIRGAIDLATPAFERAGIDVKVDVPPRIIARADPDGLAQVLGNLLQNAARYTPRGGAVTIAASRRAADVLVSVVNTGGGIPADDLPHVFERFYRVEKSRDRARGGAGIGLAIVKQLVESSGGRVGAESKDGVTRFWFSLPA